MKISIVVPAFNEELLLARTLENLNSASAVFARMGWQTEIIVCDNNSTDGTAAIARAAGASVVFEPVNQIARARNCGAAAANGDWLLFIDADSYPSEALLADAAQTIAAGRCLGGGATIRMDEKHFVGGVVVRGWNLLSRMGKWFAGSFIFVEAAAFRELRGFSEELFAGEEVELCARLRKMARRANRTIVILHRHPLLTSARKLRLYTPWEHARFVFHLALSRRTLNRREVCAIWYSGRR
jgi:glycosyltransferase involved in cell wall biosynthesis